MIEHPLSVGKFMSVWLPALAVSAAVDPAPRLADLFMLSIGGVAVPPVTCLVALIGVLGSRPLARKGEHELSTALFLLVSLLMLIVVQLWVIEYRPNALFAFVVAMGLGFSGYSLIELLGQEMKAIVSSKARAIADRLGANREGNSDNG